MDIAVKIERFQIKQNVLNLKSTLSVATVASVLERAQMDKNTIPRPNPHTRSRPPGLSKKLIPIHEPALVTSLQVKGTCA